MGEDPSVGPDHEAADHPLTSLGKPLGVKPVDFIEIHGPRITKRRKKDERGLYWIDE